MKQPGASLLRSQPLFIDFGSYSTQVWHQGGVVFSGRSMVAIDTRDSQVVAGGDEAAALVGKVPEHVVVVSPLQGVSYHSRVALENYFMYLMQQLPRESWKSALNRYSAVITYPYGMTPLHRQACVKAAQQAGMSDIRLVTRSKVVQRSLQPATSRSVLGVVVMGGSATEITIYSGDDVLASLYVALGGEDLTREIQRWVRRTYDLDISLDVARHIKHQFPGLQLEKKSKTHHEEVVRGRQITTNLPNTASVDVAALIPVLEPLLNQIVQGVQEVFSDLESEVATVLLEQGLFVSGGSSQLTGLADYLTQALQCEVSVVPNTISKQVLEHYHVLNT